VRCCTVFTVSALKKLIWGDYMLIDVKNITKGSSESVVWEGNVTLPQDYDNNEVSVKINGNITNTGEDRFSFNGMGEAEIKTKCDLCLKPVSVKCTFDMAEIFAKDSDDEGEWEYSDKILDLEPAIIANILLVYPMRVVCSEECKGLCHICGHDLNEGECGCDRTYIDPRFEKLRNVLDKEV